MDITTFKSSFSGQIFEPADAGYDEARQIWNASFSKHPKVIARCSGVADVIAAVHFGRTNNLVTAIRGGGHNVGGRALCDNGLVIDLSRMKAVFVDDKARRVRVLGGATLGDLDRETHAFGLAVPCGIVPKTGIGGLTLGGGVGWLIRKYGMTIDNLLSAQVVTADGKVLTASATENDDLFWALRGGGGNFGVVTSFEFQAYPVASVLGGLLLYPRAKGVEVIRHFHDFMASAPDELTAYAALLHGPDGSALVGVIACYCGSVAEGERVLEPLRKFGGPIVDGIQAMPFRDAVVAGSVLPGWQCQLLEVHTAEGTAGRGDFRDSGACKSVEFAAFVCGAGTLWRSRGPSFERCHRIPTPRSAVGHIVSCSVDRSDADKCAPRLGPIWRGDAAAVFAECTPAFGA